MKLTKETTKRNSSMKPTLQGIKFIILPIRHFLVLAILLCAASAFAQQLTWDAGSNGTNTGSTVISASGNWDTSTANWNNGVADVAWLQTAGTGTPPYYGAIFDGPDGTNGQYQVNVDAGTIYTTNILINNNGYTLSGSPIWITNNSGITVAAGKTATISNNLANGGNYLGVAVGSGSVLNLYGTYTGAPHMFGAGTVNLGAAWTENNTTEIDCGLLNITTNGSMSTGGNSFYLGYQSGGYDGLSDTVGAVTINGGSLTMAGNKLILGRNGGTATFMLQSGIFNFNVNGSGTVVPTSPGNNLISIPNNDTSGDQASFTVSGGTMTMGNSGYFPVIGLLPGGSGSSAIEHAAFTQTGGTIMAWGGITIGETAGTSTAGTVGLTNSGGFLYLGANGIDLFANHPPNTSVTFSGGTVGALASWSSLAAIELETNGGNVTFQTMDNNGAPWNISLSGALSGPGGFYETGGGILTLSSSNTFSGDIVVSNGTLSIATSPLPTNGPVTLDGSAGSPVLSMQSSPGQYWTIGTLTCQNGTPTADFQFGTLTPSTTVAPIQVNGDLDFTAAPNVTVEGSALSPGTYPLITYTGNLNGTQPTIVSLPGYASGHLSSSGKTLSLVITTGSTPAYFWAVGSSAWDFTSSNWKGAGTKYEDGNAVIFDDSASGTSPITVALNTVVNPSSVTFNNSAKQYIIKGTGSIGNGNSASVSLLGNGTVTLGNTNTYAGGTTLSAGQLNINNGGDNSGLDSAIGTGTLTIGAGTAIDNTSGTNVTLVPSISENWNGNFTYVGASNSFNTGPGSVTLDANVNLTVNSNDFIVEDPITDNGANYSLSKSGNGVLTLSNNNSFGGSFSLVSGEVALGNSGALGTGIATLTGGSLDNVSGAPLTLQTTGYHWSGGFSYLGTTTNELDLGSGPITANIGGNTTLNIVSNTFETDGAITCGNDWIIKTGNGTWICGGGGSLQATVTGGMLVMQSASPTIAGDGAIPGGYSLVVESKALVLDNGGGAPQISTGSAILLTLGGILDLNGNSETPDAITMDTGGTVRNGTIATAATLSTANGAAFTLGDATCQFYVASNSTLTIDASITGTGGMTVSGLGELDLTGTNDYTGETIIQSAALGLQGLGSIGNSAVIYLANSSAALDLSQSSFLDLNDNPELTLTNGQTLSGFGIVTGLVATISGTTLAPGSATNVGTLTVTPQAGGTGDVSILNGTLLLSLNRTNAQTSSSVVFAGGNTVTYGGTLSVTNIGPALQVGDVFHLFPSAVTTFASIQLPTTDASGTTYTWNNNVADNGSVTVATVTAPINPNAGPIQFSRSGATLSLSWPTNAGWILQTNSVSLTNTNAWQPYQGSSSVTNENINIDPHQTNVFFRLVHP